MPFLLGFEAPDCPSKPCGSQKFPRLQESHTLEFSMPKLINFDDSFWSQISAMKQQIGHHLFLSVRWVPVQLLWLHCDSERGREESNYPPIIDCGLAGTWEERERVQCRITYISTSPSFKIRIRKIPVHIPSEKPKVYLLGNRERGRGHSIALQLLALFWFSPFVNLLSFF